MPRSSLSHSSTSSPGERSQEVRSSSLSSTARALLRSRQPSSMSSAYCSNTFHRSLRPTSSLAIRFDRPGDPSTLRATELLDAFGAVQCVVGVTQDRGGTLDVVFTRVEDRPSTVDIISPPGGASDHRLVAWPFHAAQVETPVYRTQRRRSWRKFDVDQFRADLQSSCLCDGFISSSLGQDDSL